MYTVKNTITLVIIFQLICEVDTRVHMLNQLTWMPQVQQSVALESYLENRRDQNNKTQKQPVTQRGQSPK